MLRCASSLVIAAYGTYAAIHRLACKQVSNRLLKNAHLLRCAHHSSLRRTKKYASFLMILRALHPCIFEQPVQKDFINILLKTGGLACEFFTSVSEKCVFSDLLRLHQR
jgi:hypothetical protein